MISEAELAYWAAMESKSRKKYLGLMADPARYELYGEIVEGRIRGLLSIANKSKGKFSWQSRLRN